jgi:hypothetical protein
MTSTPGDHRSPERRARDERIAEGPKLTAPILPPDAPAETVESHLARFGRRPLAVAGVVENGLIRPLDASVKLPEHARVIIVASEGP